MKKRVVIDFDNTMGIKGCDIDDALALFTLLGNSERAELVGITTAYGNSTIENVNNATNWLVEKLGLNIPVHHGASCPDEPISEAAEYLAKVAAENPGEIHLLVTGSTTNLKGAAIVDKDFFNNLASITAMGGICESLYFNGNVCNELNLSCDPEASLEMLQAPCPVSIAVSQNCLPALFNCKEFREHMSSYTWLVEACSNWFDTMEHAYGMDFFVGWDMTAALYLVKPEMFEDNIERVTLNKRLLSVGYLEPAHEDWPHAKINFPKIKDKDAFVAEIYRSMKAALDNCANN